MLVSVTPSAAGATSLQSRNPDERAILVFIAECEALLLGRKVLSEYGSAEALTRKKLITDFLQKAGGFETQQLSERRVVLVLAANLREHLDPALLELIQTASSSTSQESRSSRNGGVKRLGI